MTALLNHNVLVQGNLKHPPICHGEWICITGDNGSGKSTLVKSISASQVNISYMAQDYKPSNYPLGMRVSDYLCASLAHTSNMMDSSAIQGVYASYSTMNIASYADQRIATLSRGQLQKVVITEVLNKSFNLLLLDEPFNHLDTLSINSLIKYLKLKHLKQAFAMLVVTHQPQIKRYCSKIWHIKDQKCHHCNNNKCIYD